MATKKKWHSGMNCEKTGKYNEYSKSGKLLISDVDVKKDDRFPPTQEKDAYFTEA